MTDALAAGAAVAIVNAPARAAAEQDEMDASGPCGDLIKISQHGDGWATSGVAIVKYIEGPPPQACASLSYGVARSFDLCEFPEVRCSPFVVYCVEFAAANEPGDGTGDCSGFGGDGGPVTATVSIYQDDDGGTPATGLTHLASEEVTIPLNTSVAEHLHADFPGGVSIDCGKHMVVKVSVPSEVMPAGSGGRVYLGTNTFDGGDNSYLMPDCTPLSELNIVNCTDPCARSFVLNVWGERGECACCKITRAAVEVHAPSRYPFPPDRRSTGQLKGYATCGDGPEERDDTLRWRFVNPGKAQNDMGCALTPEGLFTAGTEVGEGYVEVEAYLPSCPGVEPKKVRIEISCEYAGCADGDCGDAGTGHFDLDDGLRMSFALGSSGRTGSAGNLVVEAGTPSTALFTPGRLQLDMMQENVGVDITRDASMYLRQVYNPAQALVDIVASSAQEYSLGFYSPAQVGEKRLAPWAALGSGLDDDVLDLVVYDDGSGPALYAAGAFTSAGGVTTVNRIARWKDGQWSSLGSGMDNTVRALAVYDDGSGSALYAGGSFSTAGGSSVKRIAKWDGSSWSALGTGDNNGVNGTVYALAVHNDGNGEALYVAGGFNRAAGSTVVANYVAKWDGQQWSGLTGTSQGNGTNGTVFTLAVHDDGGGAALYAGGDFVKAGGTTLTVNRIAKWYGSVWSALGSGMANRVSALVTYDGKLIAGGNFWQAGGLDAIHIAQWDGSAWSALGDSLNGNVSALGFYDDANGPALYAGGSFTDTEVGGIGLRYIGKWDGASWSSLGDGITSSYSSVRALAVHDGQLVVGGNFSEAGRVAASNVATWAPQFVGCYALTGSPFARYVISKVDDNHLRVAKYADEAAIGRYDYTYTPATSTWELASGDADGDAVRVESLAKEDLGGGSHRDAREIYTVDASQQQVMVHQEERTYQTTTCGASSSEQITQQRVDPNGADRRTTWSYYTSEDDDVDHSRCGCRKSAVNPDGSWVMYDYDADGRTIVENRSWLDDAMPASANATNAGRRTVYDYTPLAGDGNAPEYSRRPRTATEYIHDTVVSRTFHIYYTESSQRVEVVEQDADVSAGSGSGDADNLVTTTTYYGREATGPEAGRVYTIEYPDGRVDTYEYADGLYDPDTHEFPAAAGRASLQTTITHGTTSSPNGIANSTTREVTIVDDLGPVWLEETLVCVTPGTFASLGVTRHEYDEKGHRTATYYANGTEAQSQWGCCNLESETSVDGTETTYDLYDPLGRLLTKTLLGIADSGNPGDVGYRPSITTTYTYDGMGRQLTRTVGGALTTAVAYRLDGRLDHTIGASGLQTDYAYPSDSPRIESVTRPGEAPETTEYYLDGRIKKVTRGTSPNEVVVQYYEYAVEGNCLRTRVYSGDYGADMWSETVTDGFGRTMVERHSGFPDGGTPRTVETTYEYYTADGPAKGNLKKVLPGDGTAAAIYEYDDLGEVYRTGLDVDGSGALANASTDRISETRTEYASESDAWWQVTTSEVYNQDGVDDTVTVSIRKEWLSGETGVSGVVTALSESIDANGNETTTVVTVDAASKTVTRTTDYPDSNVAEQVVTLDGLVDWTTSKTGLVTQYAYDALGRQVKVIDPRTGASQMAYYDTGAGAIGKVQYVQDPDGRQTVYNYDANGRLFSVENPAHKKQYFEYNDRGQQIHTWGDTTYPVAYEYDDLGRMTVMKTYRDPDGTYAWTGATWPNPNDGDAEITQWTYDPASGLLTRKTYDDATHVDYTYTADGRLETRTWARQVNGQPLVTTYDYFDDASEPLTHELQSVTYSDGTPAVAFTYNRLGQQATVTDAVGTRTFGYNAAMQLATESINPSGGGLYTKMITRKHEDGTGGTVAGRVAGFQVGVAADPDQDYDATYGYEAVGRLAWITGPGLPAYGVQYTRLTNSQLVEYAQYKSDASTVLSQRQHAYEPTRDLIDYVENKAGASMSVVSKYDYTNDDLARRTAVIHSGSAFAATHNFGWGYNDRSELTAADRYTGTTPGEHTASPFAFGYEYDNIGNRQTYTQDGGAPSVYTANELNQYEEIAPANQMLAYDEDGNLVRMGASAMGDFDEDGDVDLKDFLQFQVCFGQTGVGGTPCAVFDFDSNGTIDQADYNAFHARVTGPNAPRPVIYTWDAENRLASVEPEVLAEGAKKVEFTYDYRGRRVRKTAFTYTSGQWVEDTAGDQLFVYDGWNVVLVLDANAASATLRKYTWGLDLSGTIHGAGGIGGLLAVEETTGPNAGSYWFCYDGNGNVGQVIRADDQTGAARYEYDPYGNPILTDGPYAAANPFRFSTKWLDPETGLCYYGYRYYSPRLGRWLTRDPLWELAGAHLYAFVRGNPITLFDPLGLLWSPVRWAVTGSSYAPDDVYYSALDAGAQEYVNRVERMGENIVAVPGILLDAGVWALDTLNNISDVPVANPASAPEPGAYLYETYADIDIHPRDAYDALSQFGATTLFTAGPALVRETAQAEAAAARAAAAAAAARASAAGLPDPVTLLQSAADRVSARLAADPTLARQSLSEAEYAAYNTTCGHPMNYGKAMEKMLAEEVERDPLLRSLFMHVGGPYDPDFVGRAGTIAQDLMFDVTTLNEVPGHAIRPYGSATYPITYERP